ncbi:hypothetical protein D2917_17060 [Cupriavidus oxalaticus]|uniref:Uncharacterized protein n=1 Tax=Cupriavidus oxalaticus TaxID=96344 RepID=A0A5P3VI57_9BURK|nr:hypothetical protein D2917_17060 [Cupriavidus oxalaticus]
MVARSASSHIALVVQLMQAWQMGTPSGIVRAPKERQVSQQRTGMASPVLDGFHNAGKECPGTMQSVTMFVKAIP